MQFNPPVIQKQFNSPLQVFADSEAEQQFQEEGIVSFPLLDADEIEELNHFYLSLPQDGLSGFHASFFRDDYPYRKLIDEKLKKILSSKLGTMFPGFYPLYGNFMVKEPDTLSAMKLHQDWTYVNEEKSLSFAIWVPLMDVNEKNGSINFMKHSHKYSLSVRGPGIACPFEKNADWIEKNALHNFPLLAGEAIAWNHRLVHGSPPNFSEKPRIAATLIMVPKNERVVHLIHDPQKPGSEVEVFEVDSDFFMRYKIGTRPPESMKIGFFNYPVEDLSPENLKKIAENFSNISEKL